MGPWYKKVNDQIQQATHCSTTKELIALLGEPSKREASSAVESPTKFFQRIGSLFRFGDDEWETVFTYVDPYRPRHRYKFGITSGQVNTCWRETVDESNKDDV